MRKRILFTGGNGFIGRNVIPILQESFDVYAPEREELDLFDAKDVREYLLENRINCIVHSANPNPSKNKLDTVERMLRDSLQMFMTMYSCRDLVEKLIYLGSGAIYDKTMEIRSISEECEHRSIPKDDYGFAKYIMSYLTKGNIYNLCLFGCYGPGDADHKFITHCIRCCLRHEPITIHQNCMFDYFHVTDLGRVIAWMINAKPQHHTYNVCSGEPIPILDIAKTVKRLMESDLKIEVFQEGWNREYTGSNARLIREYPGKFVSLEDGIKMQIKWEKENYEVIKK